MQSYLSMHPLQREEREEREEQLLHLFEVDEEEVERIQLKNDLVKLAFEGEFPPPVDLHQLKNGRILDVGCGPGFWCIDLAQKYPSIKVIGVDCENVFPEPITMPYNCQLKRFNVLNGLGQKFEENSFDGIHIRFMALSFTAEQYARVIKDCWQLLKPGGFMEILESDVMICSPGPTTAKLNHEMAEMASSRGIRPWLARHIAELIPEDAENKQEKYRSLPIGWGGRLGVLFRDDMLQLLTKFQPAVRRYYGRTESSQQMFEAELSVASREMEQYRSYSNFHHFTFQKPVIKHKT
ncbi:hypothetical protein EC973_008270 [Apophysomyces ossiformis]|uniref:Methyltransferase domain-containing protein n=1 Tax=Apophysomyces ossiformis TaxID=679940 RepID=A0A8H7EVC5_9FUNG|nr:hypothetical protein EC973_008270 [Apophysomyces ossiformis]